MIALCINYIHSPTDERHVNCFLVVVVQKNKLNLFFNFFFKMTLELSLIINKDSQG